MKNSPLLLLSLWRCGSCSTACNKGAAAPSACAGFSTRRSTRCSPRRGSANSVSATPASVHRPTPPLGLRWNRHSRSPPPPPPSARTALSHSSSSLARTRRAAVATASRVLQTRLRRRARVKPCAACVHRRLSSSQRCPPPTRAGSCVRSCACAPRGPRPSAARDSAPNRLRCALVAASRLCRQSAGASRACTSFAKRAFGIR
mmetsp:Transcript_6432/g.14027  ORF Transcript_6432/g.14027 Transcript_6432/m.14027 type:complete len:203 (-) Transcript_6432:1723-2331(-)